MKQKKYVGMAAIVLLAMVVWVGKIVLADTKEAQKSNVTLLQNQVKTYAADQKKETSGQDITVKATYKVMNQKATVTVTAKAKAGVEKIFYVAGKVTETSDPKWDTAKEVNEKRQFVVAKEGNYSVLVVDGKGKKKIATVSVVMEMKAVWVYYQEMDRNATSYSKWKKYIDTVMTTCKKKKMNTVIFQVRPCADAMYSSKYFTWSKYATGKAGKNPGFDPFQYAVTAAHKNGLSIQAWINPYRITISGTKIAELPKASIARKWAKSKKASTRRNVLKVNGALYFNPASTAVQNLVANGVREIVKKYPVDGIHMDDYFYPSLGSKNYKKFDYKEYKSYVSKCKKNKKKSLSLVSWRRENVNKMVRKVYSTVKKADSSCVFGISPAGNLTNLYSKTAYYSPVKTWMNSDQYIDYICPQIYWSFTQKYAPYKKVVQKWTSIKRSETVNLYIGLAGYRAGISKKEAKLLADKQWATSNTILKRQVLYARNTKKVDGFMVFSYGTFTRKSAAKEVKNFESVINAR